MSYVKKTTGGGKIDPPPAGIGLKEKPWYYWFDRNVVNVAKVYPQYGVIIYLGTKLEELTCRNIVRRVDR